MSQYRFIATGNYVDFYDGAMHVIKLHNTSRCVAWLFDDTPGINFKIDEMIYYHTDDLSDISFDDVPCATQADFVTGIQTMFPGLAGGGGGGNGIYGGSGSLIENTEVELDGNTINFKEGIITRFGIFSGNTSMKSPDGNTSIRIDNGTMQFEGLPAVATMENKKVAIWDTLSGELGQKSLGIDDVLAQGQAITANRTINAAGFGLTHIADTHTFNGNFKSGTDNTWDLNGKIFKLWQGDDHVLLLEPTAFKALISATQGGETGTNSNLVLYADPGGEGVTAHLVSQTAGNTAGILLDGATETITHTADHNIFSTVQVFADNAAAVSGGLAVGTLYRTGDDLKIVHA